LRIVARSPPCAAKPRTFSDSTGNTGHQIQQQPPSRARTIRGAQRQRASPRVRTAALAPRIPQARQTRPPFQQAGHRPQRRASLPPSPPVDSSTPATRVNSPTRCTRPAAQASSARVARKLCAPLGSI
jgi:hypothetical protein